MRSVNKLITVGTRCRPRTAREIMSCDRLAGQRPTARGEGPPGQNLGLVITVGPDT